MSESMSSIAQAFRATNLKKIVGVYQLDFLDFKASGLGDFIRGSITMMQLLRLLKKYTSADITYDMDFRNHPMSKYILTDDTLEKPAAYSELSNLHIDTLMVTQDEDDVGYQHLLRETIRFMNRWEGQVVFGFVCRDIVFEEILESERALLQSRMKPTPEMDAYITDTLSQMGITGPFTVLHLRLADDSCFPPIPIGQPQIDDFVAAVNLQIKNDGTQYVVLSNSEQMKEALQGNAAFHMKTTAICHIGQDENQTDAQTRDTLLDYFILSRASEILAFSTYAQTGFSLGCSRVYSIPYSFTNIPLNPPPPTMDY